MTLYLSKKEAELFEKRTEELMKRIRNGEKIEINEIKLPEAFLKQLNEKK